MSLAQGRFVIIGNCRRPTSSRRPILRGFSDHPSNRTLNRHWGIKTIVYLLRERTSKQLPRRILINISPFRTSTLRLDVSCRPTASWVRTRSLWMTFCIPTLVIIYSTPAYTTTARGHLEKLPSRRQILFCIPPSKVRDKLRLPVTGNYRKSLLYKWLTGSWNDP